MASVKLYVTSIEKPKVIFVFLTLARYAKLSFFLPTGILNVFIFPLMHAAYYK